jgi:hypothetical protein
MKLEIEGKAFEIGDTLRDVKLSYYIEVSRANKKFIEAPEDQKIDKGIDFLNLFSGQDFNFLKEGFILNSILEAIGDARVLFNALVSSWEPPQITDNYYKFSYKDVDYKTAIYGVGGLINGGLNYAEYSECREAARHITYDDDGTTEFTSMCKCIGVIAKPIQGQDEPYESVREFVEETNKKALYFQDIDAKSGLDIDFFFGNTFKI